MATVTVIGMVKGTLTTFGVLEKRVILAFAYTLPAASVEPSIR